MACKAWGLAAAHLSNFSLHLSTHQLCCSPRNFLRVAWASQTPFCLRISAQAVPLAEGLLPIFTGWFCLIIQVSACFSERLSPAAHAEVIQALPSPWASLFLQMLLNSTGNFSDSFLSLLSGPTATPTRMSTSKCQGLCCLLYCCSPALGTALGT